MNNHDSDILWWPSTEGQSHQPGFQCSFLAIAPPSSLEAESSAGQDEALVLLLPSRLLVPKTKQVAWQVPAGCDTDIPKAPGSASTHTNPSNPHRHDLKACCCWKFDLTLCHVPPCNTPNISSVNNQAWLYLYFFFPLSLEREKGHQKQSCSHQIHCLSALCNRPLDIGSASDNTWIDFPPHIWKVLGMTHLTPSQMLWVQL